MQICKDITNGSKHAVIKRYIPKVNGCRTRMDRMGVDCMGSRATVAVKPTPSWLGRMSLTPKMCLRQPLFS